MIEDLNSASARFGLSGNASRIHTPVDKVRVDKCTLNKDGYFASVLHVCVFLLSEYLFGARDGGGYACRL